MALEEYFLVIGITGMLTTFAVPFILRALNKGEKQIITTNNYYNLQSNMDQQKKEFKEHKEYADERFADQEKRLRELEGGSRVQEQQISVLETDRGKIDERLRNVEIKVGRIANGR